MTATYRIGDEAHETTGVGYHDHNWGNVSLAEDRPRLVLGARAGRPVLGHRLATSPRTRGTATAELPIFMLARDGEVVADDPRRVRFEELDIYTDESTGKPVATITRYTYAGDDEPRSSPSPAIATSRSRA